MQIFVKTLIQNRTITLDLEHDTTIEELKNILVKSEALPYKMIGLTYGIHILQDSRCLSDYLI